MGVQLVNNREKVVAELKRQVAQRINAAAQLMVGEAQRNANVDTGYLRSSIGQTITAVPERLEAEVRSLAKYSQPQDTGMRGNLYFTRAWLRVREIFPQLIAGKISVGTAGPGVVRASEQEFHGPLGSPRGGKP